MMGTLLCYAADATAARTWVEDGATSHARETPKTWRDGPTGRDGRVDDVSGTSAPSNTVWGRNEFWPALRHPSLALYW